MGKDFLNKVAVVTGSGSGIGKAIALEFCKKGACVMLNGRNETKLKQTAEEFSSLGYHVDYFVGDVTNNEICTNLVAHTVKSFGTINILVANGSISMNARFDEMRPEIFKSVLDSNVYGAIMPVFAALDIIKKTRGSILFISSIAAFHGVPTASAYSSGKMALTALQQSLSIELNNSGVHVGILYVGFTENDKNKKLISGNGEWKPVPERPRILQLSREEVANAVVKMVKYRTKRKTLSFAGKSTSLLSRYSPWLISSIARIAQKNLD